jgi:dCTP diphosphatase
MMVKSTGGSEDPRLEDLRSARSTFIRESDWEQFPLPTNLAAGLSGEVAKIIVHFQWLTEVQSKVLSPEKLVEVREEKGDVMIYLAEIAQMLGIDPVEAA